MKIDFNQIVVNYKGDKMPDNEDATKKMTLGKLCEISLLTTPPPTQAKPFGIDETERKNRYDLLEIVYQKKELTVQQLADLHKYVKPILHVAVFGTVCKMLEGKGDKNG